MDISEKARIRIEHWIRHNEDHVEEYKAFARELEAADKGEIAQKVRATAVLLAKSNEYLADALRALG